jgi:hypothetical protein
MSRLRNSTRFAPFCLVLACRLAPAGLLSAQQTIAYYHPAAPLYPLFGQELDLNGDGQVECRLLIRNCFLRARLYSALRG